jgi:type I restriction enzyme S subunit
MTARLQPYTEYKESGLPWLGEIPAHWEKCRIKAVLREIDRRTCDGHEPLLSLRMERGLVPHNDVSDKIIAPEHLLGYKLTEPGELVVNRMRAATGLIAVTKQTGLVSPDYAIFTPAKRVNLDYMVRLFQTPAVAGKFRVESRGLGTGSSGFLRLYSESMGAIPIALPPLEEQNAIVRYLAAKDREISRFIRNRRRLIEILNEQKQGIINHAVTRGLDPDVTLKPSGVEWLGNIPEHWEVRRLRHLAELRVSNVDKNSSENEQPVRLCNYTDVYKNNVITADMPFMAATATNDEIQSFHLRVDDVIITKDSEDWEDIGVPAVVVETADDLVCGYHLAILRPKPSLTVGRFLAYAMQCQATVTQLSVASTGVTRYGLSQGAIKGILLPAPPVAEQEQIHQHIDDATVTLNEAIRRAQREIDLIREYRTRLIVDVVTGKLDVRQTVEAQAARRTPASASEESTARRTANIHFRRSVFAAEIVHRLHREPTFGHVKFEKLVFLCERQCGVDTGSTYFRQAAGPYDNRALRSIDSQMKRQQWYAVEKTDRRYQYVPLAKAGEHREYFDRYFTNVEAEFERVIGTFRRLNTERCEIVATLYSAWEDLLAEGVDATDERIIEQVVEHWHPSKRKIEAWRWPKALEWMREKGFCPKPFSVPQTNACPDADVDDDLTYGIDDDEMLEDDDIELAGEDTDAD